MEDHHLLVDVDLTNSTWIRYKFLGTVRGKKTLISLHLPFHIIQLSPTFACQSCFKLCSYIHIKASRGLPHYIGKTHYTWDCLIFLELFQR